MELFIFIILLAVFVESSILIYFQFAEKSSRVGRRARRQVFVDTSVLMDGRILSVAKAGFLGDNILIPRSVIRELQLLADGSDADKRARARYGLDVANALERVELAQVEIFPDDLDRVKVDERLIELAKQHRGVILTNDFNLAKVAATEHISVININDLAQGLRSEYLPGDQLTVQIVSAGNNPKQGVAYLADGTMIVVDDAERYVGGQAVEIVFERYLQTAAGKMMFAKLASPKHQKTAPRAKSSKRSSKARRTNAKRS